MILDARLLMIGPQQWQRYRRALLRSTLCTLVILGAGCAAPQAPAAEQSASPGLASGPKRVTAAMMSNPPTISSENIITGSGTYPGGDVLEELLTGGLTHRDGLGQLRPQLAEAVPTVENGLWKLLPDGRMETTWKLRENARWHDATPLSADDVLFTATLSQDRDLPIFGGRQYRFVDKVEAPDARSITVHWKQTFIRADEMFETIRPKHILERTYLEDKASIFQHPYWTDAYVGAGPFKLREFVRDSHVTVVAYDQYVFGRPKIDEILIKFIPDPNTLAANILAGAVELTVGRNLSLGQAVQLRERWTEGIIDVGFENWIALWPQFLNSNPPLLLDVRLRRAILHAIDRQALVDTIQHGMTPVAHSIVHPSEPVYKDIESSIVKYDYDPRRAAQLLESLGYGRGADGLYRDTGGLTLPLEVRTSGGDDAHEAGILAIADDLKRLGIAAEPFLIPQAQRQDREFNASFPGVRLWRQNNAVFDLDRLHSREAPTAETRFNGSNRSRYMNRDFDALIDRLVVTIRPEDRVPALAQIVQHMTDQLNVMGLWYNTEPIVISNRLRNIAEKKVTGGTLAWNAHLWEVVS